MSVSAIATTAALALLALGAHYKSAPEGPDTAVLVFAKGYSPHLGVGGGVSYVLAPEACGHFAIAADFYDFSGGDKTVRTPSGAGIFVRSTSNRMQMTGYDARGRFYRTDWCQAEISFTPEAGHTYKLVHNREACTLSLVDQATGASPPTAQAFDVADCRGKDGK